MSRFIRHGVNSKIQIKPLSIEGLKLNYDISYLIFSEKGYKINFTKITWYLVKNINREVVVLGITKARRICKQSELSGPKVMVLDEHTNSCNSVHKPNYCSLN